MAADEAGIDDADAVVVEHLATNVDGQSEAGQLALHSWPGRHLVCMLVATASTGANATTKCITATAALCGRTLDREQAHQH